MGGENGYDPKQREADEAMERNARVATSAGRDPAVAALLRLLDAARAEEAAAESAREELRLELATVTRERDALTRILADDRAGRMPAVVEIARERQIARLVEAERDKLRKLVTEAADHLEAAVDMVQSSGMVDDPEDITIEIEFIAELRKAVEGGNG